MLSLQEALSLSDQCVQGAAHLIVVCREKFRAKFVNFSSIFSHLNFSFWCFSIRLCMHTNNEL